MCGSPDIPETKTKEIITPEQAKAPTSADTTDPNAMKAEIARRQQANRATGIRSTDKTGGLTYTASGKKTLGQCKRQKPYCHGYFFSS